MLLKIYVTAVCNTESQKPNFYIQANNYLSEMLFQDDEIIKKDIIFLEDIILILLPGIKKNKGDCLYKIVLYIIY